MLTGPSAAADPKADYRADIDGLRAIAILGVVLYHAGFHFCSGGFSGVDVFFVISGYLIGGHIYAEQRECRFSFLRFYQRRVKRILPALYCVLVAILLAGAILLSPGELVTLGLGKSALAATLSLSNFYFWRSHGYFAASAELNPLLMTWSLGVEEQFYFVVPMLMLLLTRLKKSWLIPVLAFLIAMSLSLASYQLPRSAMTVFYLLHGRAWELGVGVLCAVLAANGRLRALEKDSRGVHCLGWVALLLMLVPMALLSRSVPFPGLSALPTVLGTAASIAAGRSWANRHVLSAPPLVFVGRASYSWYLWHWPMLAFARIVLGRELSVHESAVCLALSFALAVLSYYGVEQPLRRSATAAPLLLLRYAAASVALMLLCTALWMCHGWPQRYPALAAMEETAEGHLDDDPCLLPPNASVPNSDARCNEKGNGPVIALWGDSHAAALAPALRAAAHRQGYGVLEADKSSCPPLLGSTRLYLHDPAHAGECSLFNRNAVARIAHDPRIEVVALEATWARLLADFARQGGGSSPQEARAIFAASLAESVRALRTAGKQVVIFEDVPQFDPDPMWHIRTREIAARRWLFAATLPGEEMDPGRMIPASRAQDAEADAVIAQVAAGFPGVGTYDLKRVLRCGADGSCDYRRQGEMLFMDPHHLSPGGAELALKEFSLRPPRNGSATSEAEARWAAQGAETGVAK